MSQGPCGTPNMPLQRTRTPRFARRGSPLNGGSLGVGVPWGFREMS
jgi:hypothetical protein